MNTNNRQTELQPLSLARVLSLPLQERVLDRLADLLFDADEVLDLLKREDARGLQWVEEQVQRVYDDVNDVMKQLCD